MQMDTGLSPTVVNHHEELVLASFCSPSDANSANDEERNEQ